MTAYSFKKQFIDPIIAGTKHQTMRNERKRHARPGEEVQLYYGMRTKQCRLIGRAICTAVTPVRLDFRYHRVHIDGRQQIKGIRAIDVFAIADGFDNWLGLGLRLFWEENHPEIGRLWSGVLIEWKDFRRPA